MTRHDVQVILRRPQRDAEVREFGDVVTEYDDPSDGWFQRVVEMLRSVVRASGREAVGPNGPV